MINRRYGLAAAMCGTAAVVAMAGQASLVSSYAATKIFTLSVPETCYNAEFTIECPADTNHEFAYTLQSPDGAMYTVTWDENKELHQFVETAMSGDWTVMVNDGQADSDATTSIGNVKVTVKKNVEKSSETTDSSTSIAKEISGLRIYFKDDAIVVSWEDETVEKVNVQVINAKTLEKYYNDTVSNKFVEVPVPSDVNDFNVTVVPSTDASVPGATQSYTYTKPSWFINNTTDSITFPEYSNTNQVELNVHVQIGDPYAVEYYINDSRVGGEEMMQAGTYDFQLPISEGTNNIKVYLVDQKGNMKSWSDKVVLDTTAPSLTVNGLQDNITTYDDTITITGTAEDYDQVLVNGQQIETDFDGSFTATVSLSEGSNKIQVAAVDVAGNSTEKSATITRLVVEEKSSGLSLDSIKGVVFAAIAGVAAFFIIKKKKSTVDDGDEDEEYDPDEDGDFEDSDEDEENEEYSPYESDVEDEEVDNPFEPDGDEGEEDEMVDDEEEERKAVLPARLEKRKKRKMEKKVMTTKSAAVREEKPARVKKEMNPAITRAIKDIIAVVVVPIVIAVLFVRVLFLCSIVQSGSMEPTIMTKDVVVANALAYKVKTPQRGDIVYVKNEQTHNELFVKRVIGMPGETVTFQDGYVYIDGQKLDEAYISDDVETNCDKTFEVPEGCYLVLGDNRENSLDSRYWDNPYVEEDDICGKIIMNFPSIF